MTFDWKKAAEEDRARFQARPVLRPFVVTLVLLLAVRVLWWALSGPMGKWPAFGTVYGGVVLAAAVLTVVRRRRARRRAASKR